MGLTEWVPTRTVGPTEGVRRCQEQVYFSGRNGSTIRNEEVRRCQKEVYFSGRNGPTTQNDGRTQREQEDDSILHSIMVEGRQGVCRFRMKRRVWIVFLVEYL